jgi:hypothetical protein
LFSLGDMRDKTKARLLAVLLLSVLISVAQYFMATSRGAMGKDAFLQSQAERFDKYYAPPRGFLIGGSLLFSGALVGLYELLALGIYRGIRSNHDDPKIT